MSAIGDMTTLRKPDTSGYSPDTNMTRNDEHDSDDLIEDGQNNLMFDDLHKKYSFCMKLETFLERSPSSINS
jgi:hypothetical protein